MLPSMGKSASPETIESTRAARASGKREQTDHLGELTPLGQRALARGVGLGEHRIELRSADPVGEFGEQRR
jgi:hypothetical protein